MVAMARARATTDQRVAWAGNWLLPVFIVALFIPGTLPVGPLNLNAHKLLLLLVSVPLGLHWIRGRSGPITITDIVVLLYCIWISLALVNAHGLGRIPLIGTTFVEFFGSYLVGRVLVRGAKDYKAFFRYFLYTLLVLFPFAMIELLLGQRLFLKIFGAVLSTADFNINNRSGAWRLGLLRVQLGFYHPILFGIACSIAISNAYYVFYNSFFVRVRNTLFVIFMLFTSLSSGPLLSAVLQIIMITWDNIVRFIKARWVLLVFIGVITLVILQLVLPGGLIGFTVNELIFNPEGGQNRIDIFKFGTAEVLRHPMWGIGLNDWVRGWWMAGTFDNFWLLLAMRYGLPALGLLLLAIGVNALRIMAEPGLDPEAASYRSGYLIALAGLVPVLGTVHIWGSVVPLVAAYLGMGSWFYTNQEALLRTIAVPTRLRTNTAERRTRPDRNGRAGGTGGAGTAETALATPPAPGPERGSLRQPRAGRLGQGSERTSGRRPHAYRLPSTRAEGGSGSS